MERADLAPFCLDGTCLFDSRVGNASFADVATDAEGRVYTLGFAGQLYSPRQVRITMWDGSEWTALGRIPVERMSSLDVLVVAPAAPDDVWFGGIGLLHWDGREWEAREYPGGMIRAMAVSPAGRLWIATDEGLHHLVDGQWVTESGAPGGIDQIQLPSDGEAWVRTSSRVAHWDGTTWEAIEAGSKAIFADGRRTIRVDRDGAVRSFGDEGWKKISSISPAPAFIAAAGDDLHLAGSHGGVAHLHRLSGSVLEEVQLPAKLTRQDLRIAGTGGGLWVAGGHGLYESGRCWREHQPASPPKVGLIAGSAADALVGFSSRGWVGTRGEPGWSAEAVGDEPGGWLGAAEMGDSLWALDARLGVMRRSERGWEAMLAATDDRPWTLLAARDGRACVAGPGGVAREWDGAAWRERDIPGGTQPSALAIGDGELWAADVDVEGSTLRRYDPSSGWSMRLATLAAITGIVPGYEGATMVQGSIDGGSGFLALVRGGALEPLDVGAPPPTWLRYRFDGAGFEAMGERAIVRTSGGKSELSVYPSLLVDSWSSGGERWSIDVYRQVWIDRDGKRSRADLEGIRPNAVWGSGPDDVWLVGDRGETRQWDGSWFIRRPVRDPEPDDYVAVWGSGSRVWAARKTAGVDCLSGSGCVPLLGWRVFAIHGTGPDDVWAVGDGVSHFDGETWISMKRPTETPLIMAWADARGTLFAANRSEVARWDGEAWSIERFPAKYLRGLGGGAGDEVWLASEQEIGGDGPTLFRRDGEGWTPVRFAPYSERPLTGLRRDAAGVLWIAAGDRVLRGGTSGWTTHHAPFDAEDILWTAPDASAVVVGTALGPAWLPDDVGRGR